MSHLSMFFTLMRCTGKRFDELQGKRLVFLQTGRSVSFPQIYAWHVMAFRKKHVRVKTRCIQFFSCDIFPLLKIKTSPFHSIFLTRGATSRYQKYGAWDCRPLSLVFFSTNTFEKVIGWVTHYHLLHLYWCLSRHLEEI